MSAHDSYHDAVNTGAVTAKLHRHMASENYPWKLKQAADLATPKEVLAALAHDDSDIVRSYVAKNTNTHGSTLEMLATDPCGVVRGALAENEVCPFVVLKQLKQDPDRGVQEAVDRAPFVRQMYSNALGAPTASDPRWDIASDPRTPPYALMALSQDADRWVRFGVAINPQTPAQVLAALARDRVWTVREGAAFNHATPAHALIDLARDLDAIVRRYVANNSAAPSQALAILARDADPDIRADVADNSAAPSQVLTELVHDEDYETSRNAALHPMTPLPSKAYALTLPSGAHFARFFEADTLHLVITDPATTAQQKATAMGGLLHRGQHHDVRERYGASPDRPTQDAFMSVFVDMLN